MGKPWHANDTIQLSFDRSGLLGLNWRTDNQVETGLPAETPVRLWKELADRQVETGLPTETTVYIPNLWKAPWWQQPVEVCSNQWGDFHSRIEQALIPGEDRI